VVSKILWRAFIAAIVACCVLFAADYGVLRYRMARGGQAAATDTVTVVYGAPLKDGRVELYADQPQTETCARSIFPHLGYSPCWYARRHPTQIVN
jgi:hypothetical protein